VGSFWTMSERAQRVLTPDQRLRVFISSTLAELAPERLAARNAIDELRLTPVFFEHGARPHPPEALYRAYLEQSQIFVGIYWQSYGWVAPGAVMSGLEDELRLSAEMPRLLYVKEPAPEREPRLEAIVASFAEDPSCTYKRFTSPDELGALLAADLALLLSERFQGREASPEAWTAAVPAPPTSFVGRVSELKRIDALLERDAVRLVTLSGPGGIGKTRLAVEAARRRAHLYVDGVAFVALEGVNDPGLVVPTIAAELGIRETGRDPLEALAVHLRRRSLLLVVDNFEHVIEAAPELGVLLEHAPELRALVTSRELLKLRSEHEVLVAPLAIDQEAVDLFSERAAAASHSFNLAPQDVAVVAEICRRLDGVPLAIELAAPQVRLLTPEQLLARLGERLPLAGPRDAPVRQRTLEAAIGWSYELLLPDERRLFDQLGVFRGSFTLEAAESICELPDGSDLLELLASLLDKSIVHRDPHEGPRFAMLGMIRDFAWRRLEQTGELDATLARLADFYVRLAPAAETGLRSFEQRHWKRLLDVDVDNLRAVLGWMDEQRRGPELATLMRGLWVWFWLRGQLSEARDWLRLALAHEQLPVGDRGWLVVGDGFFALLQGDYDVAHERLAQARVLLVDAGDERGVAAVLLLGGILVAMLEGEEPAQERVATALATFERLNDAWGVAMSLNTMAWFRTIFDRYEGAGDIFERALAASEQFGDELAIAMALGSGANAKLSAGEVSEARRLAARGLVLLRASSSSFAVPELLDTLATCSTAEHEYEQASELVGAATALRASMRVPRWGPALDRHERLEAMLRTALGDEVFAAAQERGRARPIEAFIPTDVTLSS
jgi:predicted ATPase